MSARSTNRYLRPTGRPDNPTNVRRWWQYAGAVVRKQIRSQGFNWRQFEKVCPIGRILFEHRNWNVMKFHGSNEFDFQW